MDMLIVKKASMVWQKWDGGSGNRVNIFYF
jgi:hypothetical protein